MYVPLMTGGVFSARSLMELFVLSVALISLMRMLVYLVFIILTFFIARKLSTTGKNKDW